MSERDLLQTQRDTVTAVPVELGAVGFDDVHELGRGGFGVVYRCVQRALERTVAVKVLLTYSDEEDRARFFREQRAMGRLTAHPNVVNILHIGTTDSGRPYIVMPYHAQGSLDIRIRRNGPLTLAEALRLGVKMAGALETAHRLGIIHRDVKPANILLTDYREPALTDFGIAHIAGGFETADGAVTGSPAFSAPEVLKGEPPSAASDIYSLGSTLFCAITGHAAFERRSSEQVVAQFLRITTQPVPDLREHGIPEDVSTAVERAMSTEPGERPPTAANFGESLRRIQVGNGFPVDEMALPPECSSPAGQQVPLRISASPEGSSSGASPPSTLQGRRRSIGKLPLELTSFVGRRRELKEAKDKLSASRLVTLAGVGGVGKTRLAFRVAADTRRAYSDGVCLVELADLNDTALLMDMVAGALMMRERSAQPLEDSIIEYLAERHLLLVLDNCEQLVEAVAGLAEMLLRNCPHLRILATSREPLGIGGETVLRVPPLTIPDTDHGPSLHVLSRYDAVTLFAERAAEAVPGFEVTADNRLAVASICQRLDGLPLPIELAAARLRVMSAEQILDRLVDRYKLLTTSSRGTPTRHQTLRLSMDWSYDLCAPKEQLLWSRLAVFAGSFELDAAEAICADGLAPEDLLDGVASLVDKSILTREETGGVARFRMLDTVRDYGREKSEQAGECTSLRRKHRDWYLNLVLEMEAEWVSPRQLGWIARIEREQPNLREAMEYALSDATDRDDQVGLRIATALYPFWLAHGLLTEGRRWLDRTLAQQPHLPTAVRVNALYADSLLAEQQGDFHAGTDLVEEARTLAHHVADPVIHARVAQAEGLLAVSVGDLSRASTLLKKALELFEAQGDYLQARIGILMAFGWTFELQGDTARAIACHNQVLEITALHGESMYRTYTLWAMGVAVWRQGDGARASEYLKQGLRLSRQLDDPVMAASCLEALAWIEGDEQNTKHAVVLMGAAEALRHAVGSPTVRFPRLLTHHQECERSARRALGDRAYSAASREGRALSFGEAVAYALGERARAAPPSPSTLTDLTKRERQVAELVAQGLTNKAIADKIVISQRTAQGHVEHILAKLGFTSRAQIAAWVTEQKHNESA